MTVTVSVGDVIDGVYVIERLLGQGGMGAVFVAREERLGRRVAIKVLLDEVAKNPDAVKRFEREARSAAALQSDHVTRVLSVGKLASGAPFIVMELLDGEDLATLLHARRFLGVAEVFGFMTQVCEALSEAHALGIVHRDLKPANIFLARRPTGATTVKVLDFGISKGAAGANAQALTATSTMMGTPLYMSPEQLREAKNVDGRADVWALGVVMYELLAGRLPFLSDSLPDLCALIMTGTPAPLRAHRPDVPPAVEAIVMRCIEKDPARRFATVQELALALSKAGSASSAASMVPAPSMAPQVGTALMLQAPSRALPTVGIDSRARAQAPTQAVGQSTPAAPPGPTAPQHVVPAPHPPAQHSAGQPSAGQQSRAQHPPSQALSRVAAPAGTVDPVALTHPPWLPPQTPRVLPLVLAFAAALAIGGVVFYALVFRTSEPPASSAAATSSTAPSASVGAGSEAPPTATTTATTTTSASSGPKTAFAPLATTSASATATTATTATATSTATTTLGALPPPPTATALALPPPSSAPVAAPPPSPLAPTTKPPPDSLMPARRN